MSKVFVSGRIEFLGKHTDYCGGRSIVCAIDKGFYVDFVPLDEGLIKLNNLDTGEIVTFPLAENVEITKGNWSTYPKTVATRIAQNFKSKKLYGVKINFRSDLPQAAGVSSSSAFIVAIFMAISKANNLPEFVEYKRNIRDQFQLANYLGCVENGQSFGELFGENGVGTFGGSQDHTAIICGKENTLSRFSFCPVHYEGDFKLPEDLRFVIASSGVTAEKTGAAMVKYNRLSRMTKETATKFDETLSLAQIIEKYGFEAVKGKLGNQELIERLTQFYVESYEIIPKVSEFLEKGEVEKIGELIDLSHQNADRFLANQTPETNFLQAKARELGAIAASAFGAGFGGSVYGLIEKEKAENFMAEWKEKYLLRFPHQSEKSEFFVTKADESRL